MKLGFIGLGIMSAPTSSRGAAHGLADLDHSAMVQALELMAAHDVA